MIRKVLVGIDLDYVVDLDDPDMLEDTKHMICEELISLVQHDKVLENIKIKDDVSECYECGNTSLISDEDVQRTKDHLAR